MTQRSPHRDALRLLFVLLNGSEPLPAPDILGATAIFRGEAKLHAYDFWFRYPDYLADELLDLFVETGDLRYLDEVEVIFAAEEPDIRRVPMIRYKFGAYERVDDTLALLKSHGLVNVVGTKSAIKVTEWDFLVMPRAFMLASDIEASFPVLGWYKRRAMLIHEVAAGRSGSALKDRQYQQAAYAETELGGVIPPISGRVGARLARLKRST